MPYPNRNRNPRLNRTQCLLALGRVRTTVPPWTISETTNITSCVVSGLSDHSLVPFDEQRHVHWEPEARMPRQTKHRCLLVVRTHTNQSSLPHLRQPSALQNATRMLCTIGRAPSDLYRHLLPKRLQQFNELRPLSMTKNSLSWDKTLSNLSDSVHPSHQRGDLVPLFRCTTNARCPCFSTGAEASIPLCLQWRSHTAIRKPWLSTRQRCLGPSLVRPPHPRLSLVPVTK